MGNFLIIPSTHYKEMDLDIGAFIQEHFVQPILDPSVPGYNAVNTITYGLILLGAAFYVIYPFLNKRGVKFDWTFLRTLLPYILFGISLRVLEDQHILARSANPLDFGFYIFTPGIWILTFALVVIGLALGKIMGKKFNQPDLRITFLFGVLAAIIPTYFTLLNAHEWGGFGMIIAIAGTLFVIVRALARQLKWHFFDHPLAQAAFFGQLLDTTATFVALEFFHCGEQHVLPRLLFGAFGNVSFFFIKIPLVLLVIYFLDKEYKKEDANLYGFILLFIAILGLATGGRDALTVLAGTCSI